MLRRYLTLTIQKTTDAASTSLARNSATEFTEDPAKFATICSDLKVARSTATLTPRNAGFLGAVGVAVEVCNQLLGTTTPTP